MMGLVGSGGRLAANKTSWHDLKRRASARTRQ